MMRRPCGDGNDDHGEARGKNAAPPQDHWGARIPGCQRAAASGAAELAIPARPQGSRRCTRLAVATTLPCVIELGSVCAVRAPGIVA